ncbi:MAG: threonine--tRNA ligase [Chitinophagales bacterium]|jgi:threonyl-tRNA synthetase|nr:threonine--tRNA ligase [Bacteroidota bacterium]MBP8915448.1 threonine--tRNA ligase [Chitinophagales bacterium]MBP9220208.1 threonine--tRNA ligase [Chitinophagales bacterium]MBP9796456.1 threonine--tRNA ligase [Chitinophagales bacterium]
MIKITFPDGNSREFNEGVNSLEIAKSISEGLARKIISAEVNGEVWDLTRAINTDASIKLLTWDDEKGKTTFWHSSAHLMAEALEELFPGVKFGIGPAIDSGFYYDIDLGGKVLTQEDLPLIENKMRELAKKNSVFGRKEVSKADAIKFFTEKGDQYKLELINDLQDGSITFYEQGNFVDLCKGPHIPETGLIKAVKLLNIAGAYWRGNEKNKMLTRIYGITFPKQSELDAHLLMLEEAKKRDHRKLGKELEIYTTDDSVGQGLILWMPNGAAIIEQLEKLAKRKEDQAGYLRVKTPHIAKEDLYLTSGHLPYYADSMYPPMEMEGAKYYLKAMNCPHHHKIFSALPRSYRDLPLRFAEYGMCYRYEESGALFGLMRVRGMNMNDAHIYCTEEQFEKEFKAVNDMYLNYFKIFGIEKYVMRFSTHDPAKLGQKYLDNPELWKKTEEMVRKVMISAEIPFVEIPDEAAFYGPKIDIQIYSAIGREFTLATNQVDFGQPLRFGLTYIDKDNTAKMPLVIHRAPLSTHERFIGFLLEHYAGNFPVWLAPIQVAVLPISDKFNEYCEEIINVLKNHEIRTTFDTRSEKIGRKIRDAEMKKIPCMLIVGENEMNNKTVSLRKHGEGDKGSMTIEDFAKMINDEVKTIFQ